MTSASMRPNGCSWSCSDRQTKTLVTQQQQQHQQEEVVEVILRNVKLLALFACGIARLPANRVCRGKASKRQAWGKKLTHICSSSFRGRELIGLLPSLA